MTKGSTITMSQWTLFTHTSLARRTISRGFSSFARAEATKMSSQASMKSTRTAKS